MPKPALLETMKIKPAEKHDTFVVAENATSNVQEWF